MDTYCQKLQDLANQLGDVDHPVSESSLVLQLVRGLPKEYDVVGALINQQNPTWDTTRDMLHLEHQRQYATSRALSVALAAQTDRSTNTNHTTGYQGRNYAPNYHANRGVVRTSGGVAEHRTSEDVGVASLHLTVKIHGNSCDTLPDGGKHRAV